MSKANNGTGKKETIIAWSNKSLHWILLAGVILALIGANVYWETHNTTPPGWDQAGYLQTATHFSDALVSEGPIYMFNVFSRSSEFKAPLIALLPLPAFVIFGPDATTAQLFMNFLVILMSVFLFLLFKEVTDRRTALLGVVLTSSMPIIFGLSRQFLVEYGLTTIVVMWMYFLITSDHFQKNLNNYFLGYLFGLGMLMKVSFPLYVLAPTAIVFLQRLRINGFRERKRLVMDVSMILLPGIILAGTWYVHNLSSVIRFGLANGFGSPVEKYSLGLLEYWRGAVDVGLSTYLFLGLVLLAVIVFSRRPGTLRRVFAARETSYVLASWFIVPFIILSASVNSDVRFLAPALPVIGLVIAHLFFQAVPRKVVLAALLLCVIPIANFIYTTVPLGDRELRWNDLSLVSYRWGNLTYRPVDEDWQVTEVISDINDDAWGQQKKVSLVTEHAVYNAATFEYYKCLNKYPLQLATIVYLPSDSTPAEINNNLSQIDYLVDKTGEHGPRGTNHIIGEVRDNLEKEDSVFFLLNEYELPDGSRALLYKRQ